MPDFDMYVLSYGREGIVGFIIGYTEQEMLHLMQHKKALMPFYVASVISKLVIYCYDVSSLFCCWSSNVAALYMKRM